MGKNSQDQSADEKKKYVIFGAGQWGRLTVDEYGKDSISYFIDNNAAMQGRTIEGIPVVDLEHYINDKNRPGIIIAVTHFAGICKQLEDRGIYDYELYVPGFKYYYPPDTLIVNPYEQQSECRTETEYRTKTEKEERFKLVEQRVEQLKEQRPVFEHIEIETYNRCNGVCEFCPVSVQNESREETWMETGLFQKIIGELAEMNYSGRLALFSNNEPFLDSRILEFHKYARERLPRARMHLFTNGTLLTLDKFIELMKWIDELIIDNYNQELKLIPNCREIKNYCEDHPELIRRVTIVLRKPKEILTTRGGDAPNRKEKVTYHDTKCVNPFIQMIVRPDGRVSLCCNDPLGKNVMGDLNFQTLREVWHGEMFEKARNALSAGRQNWGHCRFCDAFQLT